MNHLMDLPNQVGFKFSGVTKDNQKIECEVRLDPVGCHSVYTPEGEPVYFRLAGWESLPVQTG